jgi:hypothetical protein
VLGHAPGRDARGHAPPPAAAGAVAGRAGLGVLLTAAFLLQVTPSVWTAYRTARPTGISSGTWLLILGELTCWMIFGLHAADRRLVTLGAIGIITSTLMLARIHRSQEFTVPEIRGIAHNPRLAWDAYAENTSGRRS